MLKAEGSKISIKILFHAQKALAEVKKQP